MSPILQTRRLTLCAWSRADCARLHHICSDPRVMRFVGDGQPWSVDQVRAFIDRERACGEQHGYCRWALHHKADRVLIGFAGCVPAVDGAEIGWRLAAAYWGRGLATEAAKQVVHYGFASLDLPRITATVQTLNLASIRVIEKVGLQLQSQFWRGDRRLCRYSAPNPQAECTSPHVIVD